MGGERAAWWPPSVAALAPSEVNRVLVLEGGGSGRGRWVGMVGSMVWWGIFLAAMGFGPGRF